MTYPSLVCNMINNLVQERHRLSLQAHLDAAKTQVERNKLGQFATPTALARDILHFGVGLLPADLPIRFLDPALGTGSFFSALLHAVPLDGIEVAKGYELDAHYEEPTRLLWRGESLDFVSGILLVWPRPPMKKTASISLYAIRLMCVTTIF